MTENLNVAGRGERVDDANDHDAWLAALRERALAHARARPPASPRALKLGALALAVLAHLLFALWLRDLMRMPPATDNDRIAVTLIDAPPPEPALPEPPLPLPRVPAPVAARSILSARAAPAPDATPSAPPPSLHLYNPDGSIALPPATNDALTVRVAPDAFIAQSTAPSLLMLPHRPLKIRPNHFAGVWKSGKSVELFDRLNELIDEHLTVKKEMTTPWGSKVKCQATYLFVIAVAGCGWGFPPPPGGRPTEHWKPATELDEQ